MASSNSVSQEWCQECELSPFSALCGYETDVEGGLWTRQLCAELWIRSSSSEQFPQAPNTVFQCSPWQSPTQAYFPPCQNWPWSFPNSWSPSPFPVLYIRLINLFGKKISFPIATLFIITKTWKQSRWLSTDSWLKKMWYIHIWNITQP